MKQRLLFIIVAFFATVTAHSKVAINATNFPDENFRTIVAGTDIDKDADGYLSDEEIAAVTQLYVFSKNIASLKGIEFFTALQYLGCWNNQLTSLDVSKNTALQYLLCGSNQLASLDVSKNSALLYLECHDNKLTSLDVSKNTALLYLYCYYNQLTSLDVSKNTALTELNCSYNQLTSLDVSKNTALEKLFCYVNQLTTLDLSKNTALQYLYCYNNKLTSLDVSKNTALTELYCHGNQIKGDKMQALVNSLPTVTKGVFYVIDTKNSNEQNVCTKPQVKIATDKGWKVSDYNGGESPQEYAGSEGIAINATNFPDENFRSVVAGTDIDKDADGYLSDEEIAAVTELVVSEKNIASLKGIEFFTALQNLYCYNNQLTSLDVSKNTALKVLYCFDNQLASLDVSKNTALKDLSCSNNQLATLNVSNNTALTRLSCHDNKLTSLDVSKNTALIYLSCFNNQIKGDKMQALVNSLPKVTSGGFYVIDTNDSNEQNVCTKPQVKIATDKGWKVYAYNGEKWEEYAGSDPGIAINATNFPDENFRAIVAGTSIDKDADGYLSDEEIAAVTQLNILNRGIASLKGIEFFTALTKLYCENNQLTTLDLSKNTALISLDFSSNQLTSIDVSKNTALRYLDCVNNKLKSLDVINNTKLESLLCSNNQLTSLDVSKNTALIELSCNRNQLTSLDVSKNTALTVLACYNNQIKGDKMQALVNSLPTVTSGEFWVIDTKNSNEQNVCTEPQVKIATDKGWKVNDYNGGGSPQEYAGSDPGIAIDATNFPDENFRSVVAGTDIDKDADGYLSAKEIAAVTKLDVSNQDIESLKGVEIFNALEKLYCDRNKLTDLDVSKNTKLTELSCWGNRLTNLDVSKNTKLTELYCDNNQLTDLDVSKNTKLTKLHCYGNQIKGVQMQALVNSLPKVTGGEFYVIDTKNGNEQNKCTEPQVKIAKGKGWTVYDWNGGNKQKYAGSDPGIAINATNFPDKNFRSVIASATYDADADGYLSTEEIDAATTINVENKNIADLKGIEHFTALTSLSCGANQLSSLDVTKNTKLTELSCENNQLTSLDVSNNTELTNLDCYDNELTSLDVSTNSQLITLDCKGNELTALDVVNNTELTWLDCSHNQLTALDVTTNTELKGLACFSNQIKGKQMQALVNSLPTVTNGTFYVVDTNDGSEKNVITEPQVNIAKGKGWTVYDYNGGSRQEYAGSDPGIAIDATNFPDENFRSVIATTTYDADADGYLSTEEIDAVTTIDAENKNIADLKGIEHFTALTTLRCGVNQLMGLDVSKNTALTALYCYGNQIQGEQMQALVNSLPTVTDGEFYVVDTNDGSEKNVITEPQVKIAKGKGWTVYDWNGGSRQEYAASVESAIGGTEVSAEEKDHWYSLDGKRLSGKPTKKGIYVRNGRKVVVK